MIEYARNWFCGGRKPPRPFIIMIVVEEMKMAKIYARKNEYAEWELVGTFSAFNGNAVLRRYRKHFPEYKFKMIYG
uniref:hypothetical protein n=1 Tax=Dialister sp. TaxID=1955814 RepID=UPI0040251A3A